MEMIIHENGYWIGNDLIQHKYDHILAPILLEFIKESGCETAYDIGCGDGSYTKLLNNGGIPCIGYDGNPETQNIAGYGCGVLDFSQPVELWSRDLVLCLEMGEHVPEKYEDVLIANLTSCADKMIILSWAVKGQRGLGHVNCRNNEYIINKFTERGFAYYGASSDYLRSRTYCSWFRNTIMVFIKNDYDKSNN